MNPPDWFTGAFSFSYTATDGKGGTASAKVALTIAQPVATNHAPLVAAIHHTIATNQQDQVEPLLFSSDPDNGDNGLLTIQSYSQPAHGTLTRVGNMLTYAPLTGFVGDDLFSYVIQDPHGAQTTGTVTETVAQALKAVDDVISTNVDSSVAFNVLQNDQYSANSSFFMWAPPYTESKPPHGTVTYGQDGHMQYTPDTGFSGVDTFTYRLTYLGTNTASNTYSTGYVSISVGASGPQGSSGADVLSGTAGSDAIFGNAGDDTLWGGAGNDILDGGAGFDTVSFVGALTGITVNLTQPYANSYGAINWSDPAFWTNDGLGGQDSVRNIEAVIGSEFADVIRGSSSDNLVYGNGGNDSLQLGGGNDTAYGGDGNDTLEVLNLGTVGSYTFFGGNGDDRIFGSTSGDYLDGGSGNDSIDGGGGNDTMYGREGNDRLRGPGTLDGGDGDDVLTVEWNGTGASWLIGGKGNDALGGGNVGNDTLEGGDGNDTLASGAGDDRLDGGNGFDLVDFRGEPAGVIVDLASGFAQTTRGFKSLVSIEAVYGSWNASDRILGSDAAEGLYGDYGNDTLVGRGGHDTISGGTGDDWIEGDGGADLLTGGAGVDRFVYLSTSDFGDVITDFTTGVSGDVLDIASLLASGGYSGSTPGADGYLRFVSNGSDTLIQIDIDGRLTNVSSDTAVTLTGVSANALTAANFSTPVDINALIAAIPVSLRIDVVSTIQKPGIDAPAIYEGNSGTSPLVVHFSREGNLAVPLSAMISFLPGAGLDAADLVGGLPTNTAIVFAAGQSTYDLSLNVVGDTVSEADEQLLIAITSATSINAPSVGIWILTEENLIDGNGVLLGTVGTDEIHSHEKDDTILADSGDDRVASGAGADYVDAGDGNDYVDGGVGSDTLIGGSGTDTLIGGSGDDTYVVDVLTDVVTELTNEGIDTIQTGITYTLATLANVENLTLTGGATINGTGNAANNVLSGNNAANTLSAGAGNDTLDGGLGNDTLVGGAGDDNYVVDAVGDVVTELTNEGTDTIQTTLTTYSLATLVNVENLSYTGAAAFTGTGNATANVITGGAGADTLSGGAGNDSLDGGEGNDQALYSGVQANYTVTRTASGFTVTDEVGSEGTDTLTNIEKLAFANATQTLGTNVDLLAYTWNTHTLLGDVSVSGINQSATTNTGGAATLTAVTDPNVSLTVSRAVRTAEAAATSSAVNLQDAIAILKMIVGLPVNGANQSISPYQTLAADFDGNGSVGLTDAIGVLKHVVGLAAPEPTWHFVNEADTSIPSKTTLSPGTPQTIVTADLSGASPVHVGLVGYLSGDVDGSYAGAAGALDLDVTQPTYIAALVASHPGLTAAQFGG